MIEGGDRFVVVLIGGHVFLRVRQAAGDRDLVVSLDEVESLTAARAAAIAGTEPSDGLRVSPPILIIESCHLTERVYNLQVVNALLTQLDKLKHKKNVLVIATSNLPKAIGVFIK
jgi:SpoVK/Ycf46/Vps4 family AAA+-type ATPase